jgi:hypothetical protein
MEAEGQEDAITIMNKFICPDTSLTQDDHGARTAKIMGTQLKIVQN